MGGWNKTFPAFLKNAWDIHFARRDRLVFVLCGSVSAWIQKNILRSKAFVGRVSLALDLKELPPADCAAFWGERAERTPVRELIDVLSVTGGVPKYLSEVQPQLSADENIRRMCFNPKGYLFEDFERIFRDVFRRTAATKRALLEALANGPKSLGEAAKAAGMETGGHVTEALEELSAAPFAKNGTKRGEGTQIDLLVQTKTAVHVVEIKRRAQIPASVEDEVREKVKRLKIPRSLSIRTALVYDGELAPEVEENGYFDSLVPFGDLLS